jgi:hypothetical protein
MSLFMNIYYFEKKIFNMKFGYFTEVLDIMSIQRLTAGWTVRGSNPGGWRDFPHLSRPALGPTQPPVQCVPGLSSGVKYGRGVLLATSSAEVMEE